MKKGLLYTVIAAVLFVTLEPISKIISNDVTPYAITFWRFIIGAVVLLPLAVAKIKKDKLHIGWKDIGIMTALGILFICISMVALQIGVKKADSPSLIAIIFSSNSVFTIVLAVFILKEKLTKNKIIALCFGIAGVIACADFSGGTNLESVLLAVFAALTFSLYTVLSQKYMKRFGGVVQTSIIFLSGSIVLLIALLILGVDVMPSFEVKSWATLGYLGFLITGLGYSLYFKAIEKGGSIMGSLAFFIKPILTPFVTLVINGIAPDIMVFVAVACIVAASYFATYKKPKKTV
ncbi:MAG: DMT family transporter [Ruminococcaceae bacterium]|nr:DMT family transporter [Oscillospiraceae bacterium]